MMMKISMGVGEELSKNEMEYDELSEVPVSPSGQYFNSSVLSLCVVAVLESQVPIDDSVAMPLLNHVFLPINPRFSSIMVGDKKGTKKWKRVEVNLKDHIHVPHFPAGKSPEFYDEFLKEYLSSIALNQLPQTQPLWEIHIIKYPTSTAAGSLIFKLHHSLGDGFSLMGALLSCLQRADRISLPLTFPSRKSHCSKEDGESKSLLRTVPRVLCGVLNTIWDFGCGVMKSSCAADGRTPIRSGEDGLQFRPMDITTLTFSLDHIKQIKTKLGVTINDVITGIIFLGTRLYMKGESPKLGNAQSTALVLLNTRAIAGYKSVSEMVKPSGEAPWGNHFAFLQVSIPKLTNAGSSKPHSFVKKAHRIIKRKRNSAIVYLTGKMIETLRKLRGPQATARYIYNTMKNSSMVVSNMIGPVEKMALGNHPVEGMYFAVVGGPESISVTMVSYVGKLRVAIRMAKGFMDPCKFSSCIENAFDMIFKATQEPTGSNS